MDPASAEAHHPVSADHRNHQQLPGLYPRQRHDRRRPGYATTTLISLLYDSGFVDFKMGKASAIAVIIFVILSILTFIQNKVADDD